jgi:hypothetical protein
VSVWLTIPSKRPVAEVKPVIAKWLERGYQVALWRDEEHGQALFPECLVIGNACAYPGYAQAVNWLINVAVRMDPACDWCVIGGDDIEPDPNQTAQEIAERSRIRTFGTFLVMQPTGDRWGENPSHHNPHLRSAYIDRVCGSAWLGREFCRRMYQGNGPLWPGYRHMYVDEELHEVAKAMGILWQRRDLIQLHKHWAREPGKTMEDCPEFLATANSPEGWAEAKAMFQARKDAGFPGHEPIA